MSPILIWIGIALIGVFLYMLPAMLFKSGEGFTDAPAAGTQTLPPEIQKLIDAMTATPSIGEKSAAADTKPPATFPLPPELKNFKSGVEAKLTVKPVETQSSEPASANAVDSEKSASDEQGAAARKSLSPEPSKILPFPSVVAKSAKNGCPVKPVCPTPPDECPVPLPPRRCRPKSCKPSPYTPVKPKCPKCPPMPDMSQYIRKDSIPCWACKLD